MKNKIMLFALLLLSSNAFSQKNLDEVKITKKQKGIQKSQKTTTNTSVLTSTELLKAACCNLAESFETNPTIDVNFADALTGTKQIKMLGLTSQYLTISEENIPSVRGAAKAYGLSFIPGTWVESIQITKGAGSVINGFESISGQINTELIKPKKDIPFFLNAYGSTDFRFELNTHFNKKINDDWATSLFVHGNMRNQKMDMNHDGFMDNPLAKQINFLNRWEYSNGDNGIIAFINLKYMNDEKQTGQLNFNPNIDKGTTNFWGSEINTERIDLSTKIGYIWKDIPFQSIGLQTSYNNHNQQSYFGLRGYDIKQNSFYSNLIFSSIIDNTMNKFSAGLNFTHDKFEEHFDSNNYSRTDTNVGAFFEYTYDNDEDLSIILGSRIDKHNRLKTFVTPRLHIRYNPWDRAVIRLSAGQGKRIANIFSENQQLFATSKPIYLPANTGTPYNLNPEIAWNYGLSFNQKFDLFGKNSDIGIDFYRTDFQNQVVVDLLSSHHHVSIYNLNGQSFANSLQIDFNIELKKHLDLRTAYKLYDIQTDFVNQRSEKPLQAKHRFFANLAYQTHIVEKERQWKFDMTYNWIGQQKLPNTNGHFSNYSPSYSLVNTQVTRTFSSVFEAYIGGENIGNYTQHHAIIGNENPFGTHFDASIIYAPIFGKMFYAGLRYKIK